MKCPHCSEEVDAVPRERLNAKNERIAELETEAATAGKAAGDVDKITKRMQRLEAERDKLASDYEQHRTRSASDAELMRAGITDADDMDLARWRHSRIEGAPAFGEWLGDGAREDRITSRLFGDVAEAPATETPTTATTPTTPLPRSNNGRVPEQPAPPPSYTPQDVATMSIDQLRAARKAGHV